MAPTVITMRDEAAGSLAQVLPEFGFNCYRFRAVLDDKQVEVLWSEEGFESGEKRPSGDRKSVV